MSAKLEEAVNFLNRYGYPNPDFNYENELVETLSDFAESQLKASQDEVRRLKAYVYEIAEIALMEGADEFGYSWEDFKAYRIESDLEELTNN